MNSQTKTLLELLDRERREHKQSKRAYRIDTERLTEELARAQENYRFIHDDLRLQQQANTRLRDDIDDLREELRQARIIGDIKDIDVAAYTKGFDEYHKIPLIKKVRTDYGLGLKEAKDIVDGWQRDGLWVPARTSDAATA